MILVLSCVALCVGSYKSEMKAKDDLHEACRSVEIAHKRDARSVMPIVCRPDACSDV